MITKAAVLYKANTPLQIETLDIEPPNEGEVLVEVKAAGVCHSDWHVVSGDTHYPKPVVLGHEGVGVVVEVGEGVSQVQLGEHVVFNWAPNCGSCFYCLNGSPNLCSTYLGPLWAGKLLDGTSRLSINGSQIHHLSGISCNAQLAVIPEACCIPITKEVPLNVAALIGCAVTTGVGTVINTAQIEPGSSVAVVGVGGVGLNIIMGAQLAGAGMIIAVDKLDAKKGMALDFGADHFIIHSEDTNAKIKDLTGGRGADYVFEATGIPKVQELCLDAVRPGGSLILAGLSPMGSKTNFPSAILAREEKTIMGCYYGSAYVSRDFPLLADLFLKGKLDLENLITQTYPLEKINQAYADMLAGELARGLIVF